MTRDMPRPPEHYVFGDFVLVPNAVAHLLERHAHLDDFRRAMRGRNLLLDTSLVALHIGALAWRSSVAGTKPAPTSEPGGESIQPRTWATSKEAADRLNVTQRAVLKAIAEGRLAALKDDGRWRISHKDIEHYRKANR